MAFDQTLPTYRRRSRGFLETIGWTVCILVGIAALAVAGLRVLEAYIILTEPMPVEQAPTAHIAPAQRRPAVDASAPVSLPTVAPGTALTEEESLRMYQATAAAMEQQAAIPEGEEHGSKPSQKEWVAPAPALEVQAAPVATPSIFGSKPSQKRHP